ncbi:hypothetical protein EL17_06205 [Anditalea andensis]|uniref:Amidohydrolase-related domain-containing protein n=2 Tax=Anditalea andensis TaxID=1048983 RepID=A0A074L450_9BACT|nr:hypothetical protein EL17_06205 [Anditalea andensis]
MQYDLAIKNATVLIVETGEQKEQQNILITDGKIVKITDQKNFKSKQEIDAQGKLVTPGFIDTHIHPTDVFGDYDEAPLYIPKDSVENYRQQLSREYLPYGITTALMMGHPENWLDDIIQWKDGNSRYTDFLTCGGALISKEEREPYIGHLTVDSENSAKEKVIEYHHKGLEHIKVYHRLREPEFSAVIKTADSLNMKVFGHIGDFDPKRLSIQQTLEKGLKNYEHIATLPYSIIRTESEWEKFDTHFESLFGRANTLEKVLMMFLEAFRYIDENKTDDINELIKQLGQNNTTFSTTLGLIHRQFKSSHYFPLSENSLSKEQIERSKANFEIMMRYLKRMSESGIPIRIATDSKFGGKTLLTELKILSDYGFSTQEIFKISTLNGAQAIGLGKEIGSIEKGKTANIIIWDKSPFDNSENYFSEKTIIKNGTRLN